MTTLRIFLILFLINPILSVDLSFINQENSSVVHTVNLPDVSHFRHALFMPARKKLLKQVNNLKTFVRNQIEALDRDEDATLIAWYSNNPFDKTLDLTILPDAVRDFIHYGDSLEVRLLNNDNLLSNYLSKELMLARQRGTLFSLDLISKELSKLTSQVDHVLIDENIRNITIITRGFNSTESEMGHGLTNFLSVYCDICDKLDNLIEKVGPKNIRAGRNGLKKRDFDYQNFCNGIKGIIGIYNRGFTLRLSSDALNIKPGESIKFETSWLEDSYKLNDDSDGNGALLIDIKLPETKLLWGDLYDELFDFEQTELFKLEERVKELTNEITSIDTIQTENHEKFKSLYELASQAREDEEESRRQSEQEKKDQNDEFKDNSEYLEEVVDDQEKINNQESRSDIDDVPLAEKQKDDVLLYLNRKKAEYAGKIKEHRDDYGRYFKLVKSSISKIKDFIRPFKRLESVLEKVRKEMVS